MQRVIASGLVVVLASANVPALIAQQRITSPCADVLTGGPGYPRAFVFPLNSRFDPDATKAIDRQVLPTVAVLSFVPQTQGEYRRVYGHAPSAAVAVELKKNHEYATANLPNARRYSRTGESTIDATLETLKENVVVFVGHNDKGTFRFLDGTSESVTHLAESAAKHGKIPVIVSCRAAQFLSESGAGTRTVLTSAAGLMIADQLSKALRSDPKKLVSVSSMATMATAFESKVNAKLKVDFVVLRGCHIGGLIVAALIICLVADDEIC